MKKWIALLMALVCALALCGCRIQIKQTSLGAPKDYPVSGDVRSLQINIGAADFKIEQANAFGVESNLKNLTVSEKNGVLTVREENKVGVSYTDAMLTLYVPEGSVFESANITTGAGRLTAESLSAENLHLTLGAGEVNIGRLEAVREAEIKGGAGAIFIADGTLRDLDLEMGVGELYLTAALLGDNDLTLGVGESDLTLLGSKDDYHIEIEKGLGSIKVEGNDLSEYDSIGNGGNSVEIEGGVGAISLMFR